MTELVETGSDPSEFFCTRLPPNTGRSHSPTRALHSSTSAGRLVPPSLRANKAAQQSCDSSLFWSLSGGTNSRPTSGQQSHSLSSAEDSRLLCSDFTSKQQSMSKKWLWFLSCDKCTYCKLLWTKASAKCPQFKCNLNVNVM